MNPLIASIIGEADMHSPTERAVLDREVQGGPSPTTSAHGEADLGNPEESKEVQLANQILAAAKAQSFDQVTQLASELIRMHHAPTADSYAREHAKLNAPGAMHTQPVGVAGR